MNATQRAGVPNDDLGSAPEWIGCMLENIRECGEGSGDPIVDEPTPETLPCAGGCGHNILADNDTGYCYECLAGMHASGEFDMDDQHPQCWEPRSREYDEERP
jgi:hypothetical protein